MSIEEKWRQVNSFQNRPVIPQPGSDYYYDYGKEQWIQVKDDDDMAWFIERLKGYESWPGHRDSNCKESISFTGKQWKDAVCKNNNSLKRNFL